MLLGIGMVVVLITAAVLTGCARTQTKEAQKAPKEEPKAPASKYPERPIEVIVAYAAGGATDIACRILKPFVEKELGVPLVVTNKPGAGGELGFTEIALAKPDGYKIGYFNVPSGVAILVKRPNEVKYNIDSFEPICIQTATPRLFAVKKDSPFKTFQDLLKYAKDNPGKLTAGTTGFGGFAHVTVMALEKKAGVKITSVPLGGGAETVAQVVGGQVDIAAVSCAEARSAVDAGQLRPLVVLTEERDPNYPDVPTARELGLDLVMVGCQGLVAPRGTPPDVVRTLQSAYMRAMENPEYVQKIKQAGHYPWPGDGEKFRKFIKDQYEFHKELLSSTETKK